MKKAAPEPEPEPGARAAEEAHVLLRRHHEDEEGAEPEPSREPSPSRWPSPSSLFGGKKAEPEPEATSPRPRRSASRSPSAEENVAAAYEVAEKPRRRRRRSRGGREARQEAFEAAEGAEKKAARVEFNRAQKVAREADSVAKVTATRAINAAKNENRTIITMLSPPDRKVYAATAVP